jgi:hypothetical protein
MPRLSPTPAHCRMRVGLPERSTIEVVNGSMSKSCLTFKPRICPTKMLLDDAFQPLAGVKLRSFLVMAITTTRLAIRGYT